MQLQVSRRTRVSLLNMRPRRARTSGCWHPHMLCRVRAAAAAIAGAVAPVAAAAAASAGAGNAVAVAVAAAAAADVRPSLAMLGRHTRQCNCRA
eukprot:353424-Chlamydomonas_euryale.AAC.4